MLCKAFGGSVASSYIADTIGSESESWKQERKVVEVMYSVL